jgi:hypothetical protein
MAAAVKALGAEEALWRALLDVLGVGGDREGFRRLAEVFPASLAAEVEDLEGALAHVAGLGPPQDGPLPARLRPGLRASGRPANHPRRRLAALARLYERAYGHAGSRATGRRSGNRPARDGPLVAMAIASVQKGDARAAVADWQVADGRGGPALIGPERARELLVNAVLPLAAARGRAAEAEALLGSLPAAPSYGRTGFLEANLRPEKGRIARTALEQQGLLAMIGEWCSKGGCGRCPLS